MPWAPGQSGNASGRPKQSKIWQDAINRAIKRREQDDPRALEKLADKLLRKVDEGDIAAIKEFGDRIDGKVPQAIIGSEDGPPVQLETIARIIVDPRNTNSSGLPAAPTAGSV